MRGVFLSAILLVACGGDGSATDGGTQPTDARASDKDAIDAQPGAADAGGDCVPGTSVCTDTGAYQVCGDDGTGTTSFGRRLPCQTGNSCSAGQCSGQCVVPEVLIVLDRSSSITDEWSWVTSELSAFLTREQAHVRFGIREFPSDGGSCMAEPVVPINADNAAVIVASHTAPTVDGQTPLIAALTDVLPAFGDPNEAQYVLLITDGDETCSTDSLPLLVEALARGGVDTFAIGIGNGANPTTLDQLAVAGRTGPMAYRVANNVDLSSALLAIGKATRHCGTGICDGSPGSCNAPPPPKCVSATKIRTYAATGTCATGYCEYGFSDSQCAAGCSTDRCDATWNSTSDGNAPSPRWRHSAIWTGTEMIIWGGGANTGGRYNPATDTWTATSTVAAPSARSDHTAVWTGSEMIVWGGSSTNTGGRYNPSTDTWTVMSTANAPSARGEHTAAWTGTEMIVWGGYASGALRDGGRYSPASDTWTPLATSPLASRRYHTSIWTGSEMIIWGGAPGGTTFYADGARFNPLSNNWTLLSTNGVPLGRREHSAVWTGTEMIVWGGFGSTDTEISNGGRYDPNTNSWASISEASAPSGRDHTAVWTGSGMVVWAGIPSPFNSIPHSGGGHYEPELDLWKATAATGAPSPRAWHTAVWTGTQMIVWGGYHPSGSVRFGDGGRYTP